MLRAGLMVGIETLKLDITYRCGKKTKTSLFVLFSIRFAYFGFAEGRLHLRKKTKTSLFVLFSIRFALPLPQNLRFACRDEMGMG